MWIRSPRRRQVVALAQADDISSGFGHRFQIRALFSEEDPRHFRNRCEDRFMARLGPELILVCLQHSRPRVEQLIRIGSLTNQRAEKLNGADRQPVQQRLPDERLLSDESPRGADVLAGPDAVSRQREGGTGEDDDRQLAAQLTTYLPQ